MTMGEPSVREFERALKAAADPTRCRILKLLEPGPLCVCQIQAVLEMAPSTISKHLALLKAAGLVDDRRAGRWIHYRLDTVHRNPWAPRILELLRGPLDREPMIVADRQRLRKVRAIPVERLCRTAPAPAPPGVRGDQRASAAPGSRAGGDRRHE